MKKVNATKTKSKRSITSNSSKSNTIRNIYITPEGYYRVRMNIDGYKYDKTFTTKTKAFSYRSELNKLKG